jgi:sulfite reductase beta subunit-like hemoprotein
MASKTPSLPSYVALFANIWLQQVSQSIELQIVETLRAAGKLPNRACSSMYCTLGYTGCGNGCSCFHLGNSWLCI